MGTFSVRHPVGRPRRRPRRAPSCSPAVKKSNVSFAPLLLDFRITLEARNPARRCFRRYRVEAGTDLFGVWVVEISYGRIGTAVLSELCPPR